MGDFAYHLADPLIAIDAQDTVAALNCAAEGLLGDAQGIKIDELIIQLGRISRDKASTENSIRSAYANPGSQWKNITLIGSCYAVRCQTSASGRLMIFRNSGSADIAPTAKNETRFDAAREDFLSIMSHDLRTPLNSILGFAEIVALQAYGPAAGERYREYAQHIVAEATKVHETIDVLLTLAHLESSESTIFAKTVNAESLLQRAIGAIEKSHPGALIDLMPATTLIQAKVDVDLMHQALVSVLADVLRTTQPEKVCASVGLRDTNVAFTISVIGAKKNSESVDANPGSGFWIGQTIAAAHGGGLRTSKEESGHSRITILIPDFAQETTPAR
jgi:K+-sensing histidine kinase KdpD